MKLKGLNFTRLKQGLRGWVGLDWGTERAWVFQVGRVVHTEVQKEENAKRQQADHAGWWELVLENKK